jgi:hypothetical protein
MQAASLTLSTAQDDQQIWNKLSQVQLFLYFKNKYVLAALVNIFVVGTRDSDFARRMTEAF